MKEQSNLISVNLSSYTSPKIVESKQDDFVAYGEDNDYFQYLIDRVTGSTTNSAIIKGISNLIYGKGLAVTNAQGKTDQFTKLLTLFRPKDLRKVIYDRKALGMAAFQIIYKNGEVVDVEHFPIQTLRPEKKDDDGQINKWYYHPNWQEKKKSDVLEEIKAFGKGNKKEPEIYIWGDYVSGQEYFCPPDYMGALPYALLEEEIADYLINDAQNGFASTTIVNFNNGVPEDQEKRQELERDVKSKLTGSKGKKVVIAFNDDKESETTVNSIPLNDAPQHYEYLSKECFNKLIVGHRVTSPMLLGIRDGQSGLGNNADEIKNATLLFENIVIRVYQNQLIDCINEIYPNNLDIYFKTIQPLDFMEVEDVEVSEEEKEKQTGVDSDDVVTENIKEKSNEMSYNGAQISSAVDIVANVKEGILTEAQAMVFLVQFLQLPEDIARRFFKVQDPTELSLSLMLKNVKNKNDIDSMLANDLISKGEDLSEEWKLVDDRDVDLEVEDEMDDLVKKADKESQTLLQKAVKLVSTGTARPNAKSEQDAEIDGVNYKVRYKYFPETVSANSREFCKKMVAAGKLYRKEDIVALDNKVVNAGFGVNGADTYSIWKYKGGARCHHKWRRQTFKKRGSIDVKSPLAPKVSTNQAEREGYRVRNPKEVAMKPKDMPNEGFVNPPR